VANTLVSLSGFQRGIELAETGVNVESFSVRYFFEFKDYVANFEGKRRGFAIPGAFSREARMSGEVTGSTGIMATNGNTAIVFANDVSAWVGIASGSNAGGFYLDEATETQTRDGFRSFEATWTSNPEIT
jgi:hypothetical protein